MNQSFSVSHALSTIYRKLIGHPWVSLLLITPAFGIMMFITRAYTSLFSATHGLAPYTVAFSRAVQQSRREHADLPIFMHVAMYDWLKLIGLMLIAALLLGSLLFVMVNCAGKLFENERPSWQAIRKNLWVYGNTLCIYFLVSFLFDDLYLVALKPFWGSEFVHYFSIVGFGQLLVGSLLALPLLAAVTYFYIRLYSYPPCIIVGKRLGFDSLRCSWSKTKGKFLDIFLTVIVLKVTLHFVFFGVETAISFLPFIPKISHAIFSALKAAIYFWLTTLLATYIFKNY